MLLVLLIWISFEESLGNTLVLLICVRLSLLDLDFFFDKLLCYCLDLLAS